MKPFYLSIILFLAAFISSVDAQELTDKLVSSFSDFAIVTRDGSPAAHAVVNNQNGKNYASVYMDVKNIFRDYGAFKAASVVKGFSCELYLNGGPVDIDLAIWDLNGTSTLKGKQPCKLTLGKWVRCDIKAQSSRDSRLEIYLRPGTNVFIRKFYGSYGS